MGDTEFLDKDNTILEEGGLVDYINQSLTNGTVNILLGKIHDNAMG